MIEITVQHIPWPFPRGVHAVTLWPFIFYGWWVRNDPAVQAHERYHWHDQKKWLVVPWFIAYLCLLPFYGGARRHPMEKSAYAIEDTINDAKRKEDMDDLSLRKRNER